LRMGMMVWIVREDGTVERYGSEGQRARSAFGIPVAPLAL